MIEMSLNRWYRHINSIYVDRNFYRSPESICCHLVEVCRGLSVAATQRRKRDLNPQEFLPKSVAWWLALCVRAGVPDVEQMLWAKYPAVCPYCREKPHQGRVCKESEKGRSTIEWDALNQHMKGLAGLPGTLAEWQQMFNDIYPRDDSTDHETNIHRLTEELGELCEAVRTLSVAPEYFVSEAPDVFAWLMGFANQFDFDHQKTTGVQLERQMMEQYPSECRKCGRQICKCPPIHPDTLGRIAKEAPLTVAVGGRLFSLQESIQLFKKSAEELEIAGRTIHTDESEIKRIRSDIQQILSMLEKQTDWQVDVIVGIAASLGGIERLAAQGEMTQHTIDDLRSTLEAMPSEQRTAFVGFLNNLAASGTFQALAAALQAIAT